MLGARHLIYTFNLKKLFSKFFYLVNKKSMVVVYRGKHKNPGDTARPDPTNKKLVNNNNNKKSFREPAVEKPWISSNSSTT